MQCFKNGKAVNLIDVHDRAFHYGDGCFSTARVKNGVIELHERHIERLRQNAAALKLNVDWVAIALSLAHIGQATGTLKIVISRGVGQRGYSLPQSLADLWVFYYPHTNVPIYPEEIRSALLTQQIGLSMPSLVGVKSLNRLEQVILKAEADELGVVEALVSDQQQNIIEGVSSNCFIRINNTWITPKLRYNGVHGVMRAEILARMQKQNIPCEIRDVTCHELDHTQSLFFCNALSAMKIVKQLGHNQLDVQACYTLFNLLQLNKII